MRDERALQVAQAVLESEKPHFTILFGSRARGDYREEESDVDVLLVQETGPSKKERRDATRRADAAAEAIYGNCTKVDLVWSTAEEFRAARHYTNSLETTAFREGTLMPRDPENYSRQDYEDEQTEHLLEWRNYNLFMERAETALMGLVAATEHEGFSDNIIGRTAQEAVEMAMKALLEARGVSYPWTHDIRELQERITTATPIWEDLRSQ